MKIIKLLFIITAAMVVISCNNQSNVTTVDGVIYNSETNEISLKATTKEAVNLEYRFTKGVKLEQTISVEQIIEMMGKQMISEINLESNYEIQDVDSEGNAKVSYTITRMIIEAPKGSGTIFDSNKEEDRNNPMIGAMFLMIDKPVISTVTPTGTVTSVEYSEFFENMGEIAEMLKEQMEQNYSQFNQTSFATFPEYAVKEGDTYQSEAIERNFQGVIFKNINLYTVRAISKDKSKVILDINGLLEFEGTFKDENSDILLNRGGISGWMLVDLKKGVVTKTSLSTGLDLSITQMGEQTDMIVVTNLMMKTMNN